MDHDVETKVEDMVAVMEDTMVTTKGNILAVVTIVAVGTVKLSEIMSDNSTQIIDQLRWQSLW